MSGGVVVIRDVTDRSLRQLQEQFVALAGHELRTPLTALRGSLQLLQRELGDAANERVTRYSELALVQAGLLSDLVQDLADVIRLQGGQLPIQRQPLDMRQLVQEAVEIARPFSDNKVDFELPAQRLTVSGDPRRLQQVVLNLISNALQHAASAQGVGVRLHRDGGQAVLEVVDHGQGIPEEDGERIFERSYQASADNGRGVGVGLYLVQTIVAAHDGTVDVQQTDPHGTTFVVQLPLLE
jgi:two-component system CheB/CheR fusion protein